MERNEVLARVQDIFRDVLDDDEIVLSDATTADDIDEWDSLSHIQLIVAIEKAFKVKFTSKEILSWKNIGELIDCLMTRTA
ncbi:MAG: acyl carrier protein [Bacteroidales bacterium]|nr:acyl carrier protein [Bacteroidales bacterium]